MRVLLVVHGFVQGVGYRSLVKKVAVRHGVRGMVRNAGNGTVEIFAEADDEALKAFEKEIAIDLKNGPSVMAIERHCEGSSEFLKEDRDYQGFVIER